MKRLWLYVLGVILVAAAITALVAAIIISKSHDDDTSNITQSATTTTYKKACNIFTLADAKKLLGDNAKGRSSDTSSSDMAVTSCTYTQDTGGNVPVSTTKSATLLVRSPKTDRGRTTNEGQFAQLKPDNVQLVSGYGSNSYWDAGHGQLDILKNDTWYILSYGPVTPADRTLDQAKQLADLLINKL
jgi:hypothetical protein